MTCRLARRERYRNIVVLVSSQTSFASNYDDVTQFMCKHANQFYKKKMPILLIVFVKCCM